MSDTKVDATAVGSGTQQSEATVHAAHRHDRGDLPPMCLPDGREVALRFIRPDDAPRLQAFVGALSPESRYRRFFSLRPDLPRVEAERLANVDGEQRDALVAWTPGADGDGEPVIVGVARYEGIAADTVEVAFVVLDACQGHGLGTAMLHQLLILIRKRHFRYVKAWVLASNRRAVQLLEASGRVTRITWDGANRLVHLDLQRSPRTHTAPGGS